MHSQEQLKAALAESSTPAVLKTAEWGYDGKGQAEPTAPTDIDAHWPKFASGESILGAFINFTCEISVVAARGTDGQIVTYAPSLNTHCNHILDISVVPVPIDPKVAKRPRLSPARSWSG